MAADGYGRGARVMATDEYWQQDRPLAISRLVRS